jgi:hypothetical protein
MDRITILKQDRNTAAPKKKMLCALVPGPDGGRVLCKVMDYPILTFAPPYKPLLKVRALRGMPFYPAKEVLVEMGKVQFQFVEQSS